MLTKEERELVTIAAYNMQQARAQAGGIAKELKYQTTELLYEFKNYWPLFYCYILLLQADNALFCPLEIYAAGKAAYTYGANCRACMKTYMTETLCSARAASVHSALQRCFALGCKITGKKGLLREFYALYQELYGTWNETVEVFFRAGFQRAKREDAN